MAKIPDLSNYERVEPAQKLPYPTLPPVTRNPYARSLLAFPLVGVNDYIKQWEQPGIPQYRFLLQTK